MRASGLRLPFSAVVTGRARARKRRPKWKLELAAVMVPSALKAGRRVGIFSTFALSGLFVLGSPSDRRDPSAAISSVSRPSAMAARARSRELDGIGIHGLTAELVVVRGGLCAKLPMDAAGLRIFQPVG